jgi:N-acyl-phosphatidylethanolamine-hydrolysing phospholipase D
VAVADVLPTFGPPASFQRMPPSHHAPDGGFRNPWPGSERAGLAGLFRWMVVERATTPRAVEPPASAFPRATPTFATPRAEPHAITATWVGHSSFLLQVGGQNVLVDPVWSDRVSPVPFAGPRRFTQPGVAFDALPPIDAVLLSHDHYDHLDAPTIRRIARRWPTARWAAPLGVAGRLRGLGAADVAEHDWWQEGTLGPLAIACVPAQHFSGRSATDRDRSLWCGWTIRAGARSVYFVGDTGLHPEFGEIGRRHGPFDLVLMPVGAYAPRWFMRPVHCDPDDAVAAYVALTGDGAAPRPVMAGMHWGTFRLTDEPTDEPPHRTRAAWERAGLPPDRLWMPRHGETRLV